jgi:hypothetical protein
MFSFHYCVSRTKPVSTVQFHKTYINISCVSHAVGVISQNKMHDDTLDFRRFILYELHIGELQLVTDVET